MDELVIKVPAPFSGIEDLGFSARYPAQERSEPLRDIPLFVEGPAAADAAAHRAARSCSPTRTASSAPRADDDQYAWTAPVQLTDQVCVLAFQDRSIRGSDRLLEPAEAAQAVRGYIWNLVRPMAFTFLRDCVRIGGLRLSERIAVVIDTGRPPVASTSSCSARRSRPRTAAGCSSRSDRAAVRNSPLRGGGRRCRRRGGKRRGVRRRRRDRRRQSA